MAIRRVRLDYEDHFTQIPNAWARDRRISRRARGLLLEITSHREGWRITIASLQDGGPEGRDAIRAGVKELIDAGYLKRRQMRSESGQMLEMEYDLCDPFAADGKADSGADQEIRSAFEVSTGSSTGTTAAWKSDDGSPDDGSPDVGSPDIKKEHLSEDQGKKGGASAPPPSSTCPKHPRGTKLPCKPCGDARRRFDAWCLAVATEPPAPVPARRYDPDVYCPHLQLRTTECDACAADARSALLAAGFAPAGAA